MVLQKTEADFLFSFSNLSVVYILNLSSEVMIRILKRKLGRSQDKCFILCYNLLLPFGAELQTAFLVLS